MARTKYQPTGGETTDQLLTIAFNCGRDLDPNDSRADWIDQLTIGLYELATESYHAGQAEQYENEDW